jgi:hypothetical protein
MAKYTKNKMPKSKKTKTVKEVKTASFDFDPKKWPGVNDWAELAGEMDFILNECGFSEEYTYNPKTKKYDIPFSLSPEEIEDNLKGSQERLGMSDSDMKQFVVYIKENIETRQTDRYDYPRLKNNEQAFQVSSWGNDYVVIKDKKGNFFKAYNSSWK